MLPRLIPVLLIDDEMLIKTVSFKKEKYLGDPLNAIKIFNEKEVDELIIVDRSAGLAKKPNLPLLKQMAQQAFMPLAYSGGVSSIEDAEKIFSLGFEKIVMTTALIQNQGLVKDLVSRYGSQAIVGGIDYKKKMFGGFKAYTGNGSKEEKLDPTDLAKAAEKLGVGEIFLQNIDNEGSMKGFDLISIEKVSSQLSIPLICCGGAGSLKHFQEAVEAGASAVAAGSFFAFVENDRDSILITYPPYKLVKETFQKAKK